MMPIRRKDIEILLDDPDQTDYVVSAYADMRVKDGFHRYVERVLKNQAREAATALSASEARRVLEANLEPIRRAIDAADPAARGLAVFSGATRGLLHAVPLGFAVEDYLVIDEDPFVLPLLERWYGEPSYLVVVADSNELNLFEAHAGVAEGVGGIERAIDRTVQRDKPGFTYKKRFSQTRHERLRETTDDAFLKQVAASVAEHWATGSFGGLILLGQTPITAAIRRLLPRDLDSAVVEQAAQAMTDRPEHVADDVERVLERWRGTRADTLLAELQERWKRDNHLVASGPTEVLDALQQGRATQVVLGPQRDLGGARCTACGYRFGVPVGTCVYCNGKTRTLNAVQEILRMCMRHRVPVHLLERGGADPLAAAGGVAALLRAEANWAPAPALARASQGE